MTQLVDKVNGVKMCSRLLPREPVRGGLLGGQPVPGWEKPHTPGGLREPRGTCCPLGQQGRGLPLVTTAAAAEVQEPGVLGRGQRQVMSGFPGVLKSG